MASRFSFGAYIPGTSPVHRTSAQVKIILACAFSVGALFIDTWAGMAAVVCCLALLYGIARVPVRNGLKGTAPIAFILVFTVLVHALSFTLDGLLDGLFVALRIAAIVLACMLLTFTTSAVELTDGLLWLLGPLRKAKAPVDDFAMVISLALRFIPLTADQAYAIRDAQRARCGDFESGSPLARAKAWGPVLVPLFVRLFRRAEELAAAMEARCYQSGRRSRARSHEMSSGEVAKLIVSLALLVALCWFL